MRISDRRAGDQPLHQEALGRFDALQHLVDARTMEPILGLNPMSQFESPSARPMFAAFAESARLPPVRPSPGRGVQINARNLRDAADGRGLPAPGPSRSRTATTTSSSTRSSGRPSRCGHAAAGPEIAAFVMPR